jgi:hypothetical protein
VIGLLDLSTDQQRIYRRSSLAGHPDMVVGALSGVQ